MTLKTIKNTDLFCSRAIEFGILAALFVLPVSKAAATTCLIAALVLWLIRKILTGANFQISKLVLFSYLAFLCICVFSLIPFANHDLSHGMRGILKWLQYLGVFWLCAEFIDTPEKFRRLTYVFLAMVTLITLNGFYQLHSGIDLFRHVTLDPGRILRMKSSLGSPNTLASFYVFALPLTLLLLGQDKKKNVTGSLLLAVFLAGLIFTFSRAALLGLILSASIMLIRHKKWKWLLGSLGLTLIVLIFCHPLYENFLGSLNLKDITIGERIKYWSATFKIIQTHPVFGIGINHYYEKLPLYLLPSETYRGYAHNSYLQICAETGLAGLAAFLLPFFSSGIQALKTTPKSELFFPIQCLGVGCLAFLIQAFFDNHFFATQTAFLFWIFWGALIGLNRAKNPAS